MRKLEYRIMAVIWLVALSVPILGQTNNLPPFDPGTAAFPKTTTELWTWGISLVTPVIVWLFGKIPALPRPALPLLTPFIGIVLGLALKKLGQLNLGWVDLAQAGTVAVFIREMTNQWVTKQLNPLEGSKTDAKPVDNAVAVAAHTVTPEQADAAIGNKPKD